MVQFILRRERLLCEYRINASQWTSMTCGVPQASILALLLFSLYMLPLSQIMRKNQIAYHSYADDTQIYLELSPNDYSTIDSLHQCIDEINSWMCQNFLQLTRRKLKSLHLETKMNSSRWMHTLILGVKQLKSNKKSWGDSEDRL